MASTSTELANQLDLALARDRRQRQRAEFRGTMGGLRSEK